MALPGNIERADKPFGEFNATVGEVTEAILECIGFDLATVPHRILQEVIDYVGETLLDRKAAQRHKYVQMRQANQILDYWFEPDGGIEILGNCVVTDFGQLFFLSAYDKGIQRSLKPRTVQTEETIRTFLSQKPNASKLTIGRSGGYWVISHPDNVMGDVFQKEIYFEHLSEANQMKIMQEWIEEYRLRARHHKDLKTICSLFDSHISEPIRRIFPQDIEMGEPRIISFSSRRNNFRSLDRDREIQGVISCRVRRLSNTFEMIDDFLEIVFSYYDQDIDEDIFSLEPVAEFIDEYRKILKAQDKGYPIADTIHRYLLACQKANPGIVARFLAAGNLTRLAKQDKAFLKAKGFKSLKIENAEIVGVLAVGNSGTFNGHKITLKEMSFPESLIATLIGAPAQKIADHPAFGKNTIKAIRKTNTKTVIEISDKKTRIKC